MLRCLEERNSSFSSSNNMLQQQWLTPSYQNSKAKNSQQALSDFYSSLSTTGNYFSAPQEGVADESPRFLAKKEKIKRTFEPSFSLENKEGFNENRSSEEIITDLTSALSWDRPPNWYGPGVRFAFVENRNSDQDHLAPFRHSYDPAVAAERKRFRRNSEFSRGSATADAAVFKEEINGREPALKKALITTKPKKGLDLKQIRSNKQHDLNMMLLELKEQKEKLDILDLDKFSTHLKSQIANKEKLMQGLDLNDLAEANLRETSSIIQKIKEGCPADETVRKEHLKREMEKVFAETCALQTQKDAEISKKQAILNNWLNKNEVMKKQITAKLSLLPKPGSQNSESRIAGEIERVKKDILKAECDCNMLENMLNDGISENVYYFKNVDALLQKLLPDYCQLYPLLLKLAAKQLEKQRIIHVDEEDIIFKSKLENSKQDIVAMLELDNPKRLDAEPIMKSFLSKESSLQSKRDELLLEELQIYASHKKEIENTTNSIAQCLKDINSLKRRRLHADANTRAPTLLHRRRTVEIEEDKSRRERNILEIIEKLRERKEQANGVFQKRISELTRTGKELKQENSKLKQTLDREAKRNVEINKNIKRTIGTSFADFLEEKRVEFELIKKNYGKLSNYKLDLEEQVKAKSQELGTLARSLLNKENEIVQSDATINALNNSIIKNVMEKQDLEKEFALIKEKNDHLKQKCEAKLASKANFESRREEDILKILDFTEKERQYKEKIKKLEAMLNGGHQTM